VCAAALTSYDIMSYQIKFISCHIRSFHMVRPPFDSAPHLTSPHLTFPHRTGGATSESWAPSRPSASAVRVRPGPQPAHAQRRHRPGPPSHGEVFRGRIQGGCSLRRSRGAPGARGRCACGNAGPRCPFRRRGRGWKGPVSDVWQKARPQPVQYKGLNFLRYLLL